MRALAAESGGSFEEVDLRVGAGHRIRVSNQALVDDAGQPMGRVVLFKEISHEPLTRDFESIVGRLSAFDSEAVGALRSELENALAALSAARRAGEGGANRVGQHVRARRARVPHAHRDRELARRRRRAVGRGVPGRPAPARPHEDRRAALAPFRPAPKGIARLARKVEDYYESGENARDRIL